MAIGHLFSLKKTAAVLAPPGTSVRLIDQPALPASPPRAVESSVGPKRATDLPSLALATSSSCQSEQL